LPLFSLSFGGKWVCGTEAKEQHSSIKIHPFVCPPSRCSFGHFPFVLLGISAQKEKEYIKTTYYYSLW